MPRFFVEGYEGTVRKGPQILNIHNVLLKNISAYLSNKKEVSDCILLFRSYAEGKDRPL